MISELKYILDYKHAWKTPTLIICVILNRFNTDEHENLMC
jgi:hypothetical protein